MADRRVKIAIDLNALMPLGSGPSLKIESGLRIPLDKNRREMYVGFGFLHALADLEVAIVQDIRRNSSDPPDILFGWNGIEHGLELTELIPLGRRRKDDKLARLRKSILQVIDRSADYRTFAIIISLQDDYSPDAWVEKNGNELGKYLADYLRKNHAGEIPVPSRFQRNIRSIMTIRDDFGEHPLRELPSDPIIQFPAQSTLLVVETDIKKIVSDALKPKLVRSSPLPSWLLMWTCHHSLSGGIDEIGTAIQNILTDVRKVPYTRVSCLSFDTDSIRISTPYRIAGCDESMSTVADP